MSIFEGGDRDDLAVVDPAVVELHLVADRQRRVTTFGAEQIPSLVERRLGNRLVLDARFKIEAVWPDEDLEHPERRVVSQRFLAVPETTVRTRYHQMLWVRDEDGCPVGLRGASRLLGAHGMISSSRWCIRISVPESVNDSTTVDSGP